MIAVILGTRPEAVKLAPVILELKSREADVKVILTGQHPEMARDVLRQFGIDPDFDINVSNNPLNVNIAYTLLELNRLMRLNAISLVIVQGDTYSAMTGALAASNLQIKVAHVEAGLRTWNKHSPFPEENYRRIISAVADWHFAATPKAADNLQNEGYTGIFVTGNTAIDALHSLDVEPAQFKRKTALLTLHRRENWGEPMRRLLEEIGEAAEEFDFDVVFPMHPNPAFQELTKNLNSKIGFTPAMSYFTFVATMKGVDFILTDSGGVQEEAPTYNKPVIVLRDTTERSEGLGTHAVLARPGEIKSAIESIRNIQFQGNPYGDGYAAKRIATYLGIPPAQTREIDADYVPRSQDIHLD